MNKTILLIPIYQPDRQTLTFLTTLMDMVSEPVVVVDDGSGETYQEFFKEMQALGMIVLSYSENRGKGYAMKLGMSYIEEHYSDYRWLLTVDSDGQHILPDIEQMINEPFTSNKEMLLGVRQFFLKNTPLRSWLGNRMTSLFYYLSSGIWLPDTQTGLRKFSIADIPELVAISGDRFDYEMNQLLELPKAEYHLATLPITTVYEDNNRRSHFRVIRDSYLIYRPLVSFILASLSSSLIDVTLFFLLSLFFGHSAEALLLATVGARVMSGFYNYQVNRTFVFRSQLSMSQSLWKYAVLFVAQLLLSWLGVSWMSSILSSVIISKILVDSCLFVASFMIQRRKIFAS